MVRFEERVLYVQRKEGRDLLESLRSSWLTLGERRKKKKCEEMLEEENSDCESAWEPGERR